jgi:hypothetical protein
MSVDAIPKAQPRKRRQVPSELPAVEDKSSTPDGDMNGINRATVEMKALRKGQRMKAYFAEQPKETIKIRSELGEQTVIINGYPFQIQAGERVKVPTDVAEILRDAEII